MDFFQLGGRKLALVTMLARWILKKYRPGVIGVCGGVGKTLTVEAIFAVLLTERRVRRSVSYLPPEVAIPLAIISDRSHVATLLSFLLVIIHALRLLFVRDLNYPEILIFEYSISSSQHMKRLLDIARPQIAVVATIGTIPSSLAFLDNSRALWRELLRVIQQLPSTGFAIMNADDGEVLKMREYSRGQTITFGFSRKADMIITHAAEAVNEQGSSLSFKIEYDGAMIPMHLHHVAGRPHLYAAASACAVSLMFGLNMVKISEALSHFIPPPGRLRVLGGMRGSIIIDNSFDAVPLAVEEALSELRKMPGLRKIAVLSDMIDLGRFTSEIHSAAGEYAATVSDILITIGVRGKFIAEGAIRGGMAKRAVFSCNVIPEAKRILETLLREGDVVLVAGSVSSRLERLVRDIMREPGLARTTLVRQELFWDSIPGLYDRDSLSSEVS